MSYAERPVSLPQPFTEKHTFDNIKLQNCLISANSQNFSEQPSVDFELASAQKLLPGFRNDLRIFGVGLGEVSFAGGVDQLEVG